jgi:hypothetical protein
MSLTPDNLKPEVERVQPIMVVYFEGQIHRIPVKQVGIWVGRTVQAAGTQSSVDV